MKPVFFWHYYVTALHEEMLIKFFVNLVIHRISSSAYLGRGFIFIPESFIFCFQITYVEQPLKDPTRALGNYGVKDGDVVVLRQADRRPPATQPAFPGITHYLKKHMNEC